MAETSLQVVDRQTLAVRQTFEPTTLQEAMEFSKIIADSELAPKDFRGKPANVMVALQLAKELNVPPMQALQGIAVINSRATVWGDLMWALVTNHPAFEDAIEEVTDTQAKIVLKRRSRSPVTVTFTKADAEKAGLWGKQGPWQQYPKRQMQWRARTFAARDLFPDALKGMVSAEEASDYQVIESTSLPQNASAPAASTTSVEETVGTEGGSIFYKTWKAHGWNKEEAVKFLSDTFQIGAPHNDKDSRSIPKARFEEAKKWASTKAPVRVEADKLLEDLGWTTEEKAKFVEEQKWNWPAIVEALKVELNKRNAQESGQQQGMSKF
jgi:hypothetical protein